MPGLLGRLVFLVILLLGSAHAWAQSEPPPNVLLVIADDMGLDASPCHELGAEKPDMPVLEAMCRDGGVFERLGAAGLLADAGDDSQRTLRVPNGRYGPARTRRTIRRHSAG